MTIEVLDVDGPEKERLLSISEDHFRDLKAIEIKPAKLSKTISAFANAAGGELYVGIAEGEEGGNQVRHWRGFNDPEEANGHLQLFEELFPLGYGFSYAFLRCEGELGLVLYVLVQKTREIITASDGVAYIRRGAQSLPVKTDAALERLRLDKGVITFETQTVAIPLDHLVTSPVMERFLKNVIPHSDAETWLRSQFLVTGDKPSVAAVLLFSPTPQAALPKRCAIKIYRYETKEAEGTRDTLTFDPLTIEGCLYDQIFAAVDATVKVIEGIKVLGDNGLEPIQYPREALHEIITNAVLHRDYSIASDIHLRIFDNRIEVESPGTLPGHVTAENILTEQLARNGAIVRLINKFPEPPNKDVGEGLNTAFAAMKRLRLKEPVIEERANSVAVFIRHERLASPEEAVMAYLDNHDEIHNKTARSLTGIASENAMKEVFYRLRDQGLLERTPDKRGNASTWRRKQN